MGRFVKDQAEHYEVPGQAGRLRPAVNEMPPVTCEWMIVAILRLLNGAWTPHWWPRHTRLLDRDGGDQTSTGERANCDIPKRLQVRC